MLRRLLHNFSYATFSDLHYVLPGVPSGCLLGKVRIPSMLRSGSALAVRLELVSQVAFLCAMHRMALVAPRRFLACPATSDASSGNLVVCAASRLDRALHVLFRTLRRLRRGSTSCHFRRT